MTILTEASEFREAQSERAAAQINLGPWLEAIQLTSRHYRVERSPESIKLAADVVMGESLEQTVRRVARTAGLSVRFSSRATSKLTSWRLPVVVELNDGQVAIIETINGNEAGVIYCGDQGLQARIALDALLPHVTRMAVFRLAHAASDNRVDHYIKPYEKHWFRKIIFRDVRHYRPVFLASFTANVLALAGVLFSMQVYDRVIPAGSLPTLYVLFSGVVLAAIFDFAMRTMRVRLTDVLGKRADLRVSDVVFGHAMRIRNSARPRSTGTFISQIRELEQVRELITSTTLSALADLPFFFLFLLVLWFIAGPLAFIPLVALVLLILPGLLSQSKLRRLATESMRESSLRNGMLIETIQGLQDIKSLQAEQQFQRQWNQYSDEVAGANLKLRYLTNKLVAWTQNVQTLVFSSVVLFGAPMVMVGDITTGVLVAASILSSRMMGPMANITNLLSKWQQARVALKSLDAIMEMPVDQPDGQQRIHRPSLSGKYSIYRGLFQYGQDSSRPALQIANLEIAPGEKVAILGRNGAGKSTLLQALSGQLEATSGQITLDDVPLAHIDPADVRRDVALLSQHSTLFHGSIRDNLRMGARQASDQDILDALAVTGGQAVIEKLADGLDHVLSEGGTGLSGGQRQSLLLARMVLRQPQVVLLDEPTAALDEAAERRFVEFLMTWGAEKTVIIATHRMGILAAVYRIVVLDNGVVALDDAKDSAVAKLSRQRAI